MPELSSSATMWFIIGVALLVVEAMHYGVLAVFFAFGAWMTALLLWLHLIGSTPQQLAVFLLVSTASLFLLRPRLRVWLMGLRHPAGEDAALDDFVGNLAQVVEAIDPAGNTGKVEFRGTQWPARAAIEIPKGSTVRILARENLTLRVQLNNMEVGKS
jgi:membrane protein implicated in regulation of membrane protease activity